MVLLKEGEEVSRDEIFAKLVKIHYERNDIGFVRGKFRVRGDSFEVWPAYDDYAVRVSLWGDQIEEIVKVDPLTQEIVARLPNVAIYPATHFVTSENAIERSVAEIAAELEVRVAELEAQGKLLEAFRLRQRTNYDMEMLRELGYCNGIENYSRILSGRLPGEAPYTLLDFFPDDFMVFLDESHMTVPQLHGMYEGDRSRKTMLVEHGFVYRRRWTTGLCGSASSWRRCRRWSSSRPPPGNGRLGVVPRGRAVGPPDRSRRSAGGGATHEASDRRPHERDPQAGGEGAADSGHHAQPRRWPRTSPTISWRWDSASVTCTPRWTRWSASAR